VGLLKNGRWLDEWYNTDDTGGSFERQQSRFRHTIAPDGVPGSADSTVFPVESGRYHLFVSMACPWAHRALIYRSLKDLSSHIGVTVVNPLMLSNGWEFEDSGEEIYGLRYLYELYLLNDPNYEGRVTVPVLWDKRTRAIVNNESAEIIRILNSAFDGLTDNDLDFYPPALRAQIDAVNERVYRDVNNGVYRAGFATSQQAYDRAYLALFSTLDWIDDLLGRQPFLVGAQITEADWRLFTTLIRFDAVYHGHFKCNRQKLSEFRHIPDYLRRLYAVPGVSATVNFEHIKQHYYGSHKTINPSGIIPAGPDCVLDREF